MTILCLWLNITIKPKYYLLCKHERTLINDQTSKAVSQTGLNFHQPTQKGFSIFNHPASLLGNIWNRSWTCLVSFKLSIFQTFFRLPNLFSLKLKGFKRQVSSNGRCSVERTTLQLMFHKEMYTKRLLT